MLWCAGVPSQAQLGGVGSDHGEAVQAGGVQRQQAALVLQQHDGLARRFCGQGTMLGAVGDLHGRFGAGERLLEQAQEELGGQHAAGGGIHRGFRDTSSAHFVDQIGEAAAQLDVHTGQQRLARGVGRVRCHEVKPVELVHAPAIRDHKAVEAPFVAQDLLEQPGIDVAGDAVDLVVRGHDRADAGLDRGLEGHEELLADDALGVVGRRGVCAAFRLAMDGEMLGGGEHVERVDLSRRTALQPADRRLAHRGDEERILAVGLFGAAPARIARQVEHRAERVVRALGAHLRRGDGESLLDQLRVPGAGQADRLREAGGVQRHVAVQRLAEVDRRDAQAGFVAQEGLQGIDELDSLGRDPVGAQSADKGQAMRANAPCGLGRKAVAVAGNLSDVKQPVQLGHFFFKRHTANQVGDAFVNG